MATLDGVSVDCVLYIASIGTYGRGGAELTVSHVDAGRFWGAFERREPLVYEGEMVQGTERFKGRVSTTIFNCDPVLGGGLAISIKAAGLPERL